MLISKAMVRKKRKKEALTKPKDYVAAINVASVQAGVVSNSSLDLGTLKALLLAAESRYKQLGLLQQFKGTLRIELRNGSTKEGDGKEVASFRAEDASAIYRYLLEIALLPHSGPLRMTIRAVLDVLASEFANLSATASDTVVQSLLTKMREAHGKGQLGAQQADPTLQDPMNIIRVMQAAVSFDFTRDVLIRATSTPTQGLVWCLGFCAQLLKATSAPFAAYDGKSLQACYNDKQESFFYVLLCRRWSSRL